MSLRRWKCLTCSIETWNDEADPFYGGGRFNGAPHHWSLESGSESNTEFDIKNGVLFKYNGSNGAEVVTIPSGVTSIGERAFYTEGKRQDFFGNMVSCNQIRIKSVKIPTGVTSIGKEAFYGCKGLTSVTIPEGCVSIGERAFSRCDISEGVFYSNERILYESEGLMSVTIPSSAANISEDAFPFNVTGSGTYYKRSGNIWHREPTEAELKEQASKFGTTVDDLKTFEIEGTTVIKYKGPGGDVTIPTGITCIGNRAFYRCSGITSITIPKGVTSIEKEAFCYCSGLSKCQ